MSSYMKSMKHLLYLAGLVVLSTASGASDPVCIVGAGPTGLTAARKLQDKGIDAIIFEKAPEAGGKCQAYYENGAYYPLGALLFTKDSRTYRETLPIINESGVEAVPFDDHLQWLFDWKNGKSIGTPPLDPVDGALFEEEVVRYAQFWNTTFEPQISVGYKNGVDGFTQSTASWLIENKYPHILALITSVMAPYGYGDPTEVPILYILQLFTPELVLTFAGKGQGYIIDFREVWVRYAATLKATFNFNVDITNIDRSDDSPPVITYNQDGQTKSQRCSKLILAFPPVLRALEAANLGLDDTEKGVFEPVGTTKYWSSAVRTAAMPQVFLIGGLDESTNDLVPIVPAAEGQPVEIARFNNETDVAIVYSWGKYRSSQTTAEVKELLIETVSRMNKDPNDESAQPVPITDGDVIVLKEWDYFAHYDQEHLEQGYYARFNKLQGYRNTYYASGFNGFENIEFAVRAGQDVVASYF